MRRILAWIVVLSFVGAVVYPSYLARSQQQTEPQYADADADKAAAFLRVWERLLQSQDRDERTILAERALELERATRQWPLASPRDGARILLLRLTGFGYLQRSTGDRAENIERAIAAYEQVLQVISREGEGQEWASAQRDVGSAYSQRVRGDHIDNQEKAIAAYEAALTVFTPEANPDDWALAKGALAIAYQKRVRGDPADNLDKAIAALEAELTVITRETSPNSWALAQRSLFIDYQKRTRGDRADNLERAVAASQAALTVFTREASPRDWALTHGLLGAVYQNRVGGDRADNIEKAIAAYEAALTVLTREASPSDWALTVGSLGDAYLVRVRGDRADNLEKALASCEAALTILTALVNPREWAQAQNDLGNAYWGRVRGDPAENLEKAITAFEQALTVRMREAFPRDWAATRNNLGGAYWKRVRGNRADNFEKAIAAFEDALTIRTREALPQDWASTLNNLGLAYLERIRGDRADNQEKAIAAYEQALTVFTRAAMPREWATAQMNLGLAYWGRIRGDRADNLRKAAAAAEAAQQVFTRDAMPHEHLRAVLLLGKASFEMRDWRKASTAYAGARDAFLLLFGQGLDDSQARELINLTADLYPEATFAAAHQGQTKTAFGLASEGRARLMAVALKLQTLKLPAGNRQRLDELRADIRTKERAEDATQGTERAAAIEKIVALRQELLALVKDADAAERDSPHTQARVLAGLDGAVVVPIVTKLGGKILIVSNGSGPLGNTGSDPLVLTPIHTIELPGLTTDRLNALVRGDGKDGMIGGWLGAYGINYLKEDERNRRWPVWLTAVGELGPELWRLFGGRLDAALKATGVKAGGRVVWMPTGALGILPLGLAQDPASKRRLMEDYEFVYAPSLDALTTARDQLAKAASAATLAMVVNPLGDLPGTEKEGKLVASYFPAQSRTVRERSEATLGSVLAALKGKSYWHFATHGTFFWDDARQSGLYMSGRKVLSVGRLLETDGLGHPRLVVLSACETGLYDIIRNPDEFIGLPGTFTALGAAGVLGTLWPVDDTGTVLLIAKFYELHLGDGFAPPTALRHAQLWLRHATNADLAAYARDAARQGRLETRHLSEIEADLSEEGLKRSRNAATIQWLPPVETGPKRSAASQKAPVVAKRLARPYAHPYYWAGFIYTGL